MTVGAIRKDITMINIIKLVYKGELSKFPKYDIHGNEISYCIDNTQYDNVCIGVCYNCANIIEYKNRVTDIFSVGEKDRNGKYFHCIHCGCII